MKRTVKLLWSLLFATFLLSCGGSDNGGPRTTPPPPSGAAQFAYVSNSDSSSITAYQINSSTGALGVVAGSPFGGVDLPTGLAMAPDSKFLAIGNVNRGGISVLRLDRTSGSLTAVAGSPFSTSGGGFPWQLAFHKSGKFLYAGMQISVTSNISAFSIDTSTGTLTPVPGSPFPGQPALGGGGVNSIALHPNGNFLYASGSFSGITGYSVDGTSGALTQLPGSPFIPAGMFFNSNLTVHPSGSFLYIADMDANAVRVFPVSPDGSVGSETAGSPFPAGTGPRTIVLDPAGKFAFVPNDGSSDVTAFSINSTTGALTLVGTATAGISPFAATVDSSGKSLYVTTQSDGNVSAYTINASTGALSSIAGSPFAAEHSPISIITTQ
jgi:6-phosphogluconolactonase